MTWNDLVSSMITSSNRPKLDWDDVFKMAFGVVLAQIEPVTDFSVKTVYDAISVDRDNPQKQIRNLAACFSACPWRWPVYEEFIKGRQEAAFEFQFENINQADPVQVLTLFPLARLKEIYLDLNKMPPSRKLRKPELISALLEKSLEETLKLLRKELIERLDDPNKIKWQDMAGLFVRRIDKISYSLFRLQQLLGYSPNMQNWMFHVGFDKGTPAQCSALDGKILHYKDPFWLEHFPPCWYPECSCWVNAVSERYLRRKENRA